MEGVVAMFRKYAITCDGNFKSLFIMKQSSMALSILQLNFNRNVEYCTKVR